MDNYDSRLVLRDIPIALCLFSLVFLGVGLLMLFEASPPVLMTLIFIVVGLFIMATSSVVTVTADRMTRILKMESRSVIRHNVVEVAFDEIIGINVESQVSSGRGARYVYRLTLLRKDGTVVPLQQYSSSGAGSKEKRAIQLREFLGIQESNRIPPGMIPMELTQFSEIHENDGVHWQLLPLMTYGAAAPSGVRWHSADFKTSGTFLFVAQKGEGQPSTGFLAALGKMFLQQAFTAHGFKEEDAPGLDNAVTLEPLDASLDRHFIAYTNSPDQVRAFFNATTVLQLAKWADRYPLKQFQSGGRNCQLMILFGPSGVYVATNHLLESRQTYELISLGVELVKGQKTGFGFASAVF